MATTLNPTHSLLSIPFSGDTDFTVLADHCERFADALIESHSLGERRALCDRLTDCLNLLSPTLNDPIPSHLVESLTVDQIPDTVPTFDPESELLCEYCHTLAQLLAGRTFLPEMELPLNGLLFELVCYFADELRAPRFVRTATGVKPIDEVGESE